MNLAQWTVDAEEITILGNTFKVSQARLSDLGKLQRFLSKAPRPDVPPPDLAGLVDQIAGSVRGSDLDPSAVEKHLEACRKMAAGLIDAHLREIRQEAAAWPPDFLVDYLPAMKALFETEGGDFEAVFVALSRHQATLDREACRRIFEDMDIQDFNRLMGVFWGFVEVGAGPKKGEPSDPPGAPTGSPSTPASAKPPGSRSTKSTR